MSSRRPSRLRGLSSLTESRLYWSMRQSPPSQRHRTMRSSVYPLYILYHTVLASRTGDPETSLAGPMAPAPPRRPQALVQTLWRSIRYSSVSEHYQQVWQRCSKNTLCNCLHPMRPGVLSLAISSWSRIGMQARANVRRCADIATSLLVFAAVTDVHPVFRGAPSAQASYRSLCCDWHTFVRAVGTSRNLARSGKTHLPLYKADASGTD